jgi:hypothetical protein
MSTEGKHQIRMAIDDCVMQRHTVQLARNATNEQALRAAADGVEESKLPHVPGLTGWGTTPSGDHWRITLRSDI